MCMYKTFYAWEKIDSKLWKGFLIDRDELLARRGMCFGMVIEWIRWSVDTQVKSAKSRIAGVVDAGSLLDAKSSMQRLRSDVYDKVPKGNPSTQLAFITRGMSGLVSGKGLAVYGFLEGTTKQTLADILVHIPVTHDSQLGEHWYLHLDMRSSAHAVAFHAKENETLFFDPEVGEMSLKNEPREFKLLVQLLWHHYKPTQWTLRRVRTRW